MRECISRIQTANGSEIFALCELIGKGPAAHFPRAQEKEKTIKDLLIDPKDMLEFHELDHDGSVLIQNKEYFYYNKPCFVAGQGHICYSKKKGDTHMTMMKVRPSTESSENEVAILRQLQKNSHPNIITTFGSTVKDGLIYTALRQVHSTLLEHIETSGLSFEKSKWVVRELHSGISFLHENDIAHRNINPKNILFCSDGRYKVVLSDFSSATTNRDAPAVEGTIGFTPPEVFNMLCKKEIHKNNTFANDIYCFGATCLASVFGMNTYNGELTPNENILQYDKRSTGNLFFNVNSILESFAKQAENNNDPEAQQKKEYLLTFLPKCLVYRYTDRSSIDLLFDVNKQSCEKRIDDKRLFSYIPLTEQAMRNFKNEGCKVIVYGKHYAVYKDDYVTRYYPGTSVTFAESLADSKKFFESFEFGGDIKTSQAGGRCYSLPTRLVEGDQPGAIKYIVIDEELSVSEFDSLVKEGHIFNFIHKNLETTFAITYGHIMYYAEYDIKTQSVSRLARVYMDLNSLNHEAHLRAVMLALIPSKIPQEAGSLIKMKKYFSEVVKKGFCSRSNPNIEKTALEVVEGVSLEYILEKTQNYYSDADIEGRNLIRVNIDESVTLREAIIIHIKHLQMDRSPGVAIKKFNNWLGNNQQLETKLYSNPMLLQESWETAARLLEWFSSIPPELAKDEKPACAELIFRALPLSVMFPLYFCFLEKQIPLLVAQQKAGNIVQYQEFVENRLNEYFDEHEENHLQVVKLFHLAGLIDGYVGIKEENFKSVRESHVCELDFAVLINQVFQTTETTREVFNEQHGIAIPFTTQRATSIQFANTKTDGYVTCNMTDGSTRYLLVKNVHLSDSKERQECIQRVRASCTIQIMRRYLDSCGLNICVNESNMTILPLLGDSNTAIEVYEIPDPSKSFPGHRAGLEAGHQLLVDIVGISDEYLFESSTFDQLIYLPHDRMVNGKSVLPCLPYKLVKERDSQALDCVKTFFIDAAKQKLSNIEILFAK